MISYDKNVQNILKIKGLNVPKDPKSLHLILKTLPINIDKVKELVEKDNVTYVIESFVVYNKFLESIRLTVNPQIGDQIINVLRFDPEHYQNLLQLGYYTTGVTLFIRDEDINALIISKNESSAQFLKSKLEELSKGDF